MSTIKQILSCFLPKESSNVHKNRLAHTKYVHKNSLAHTKYVHNTGTVWESVGEGKQSAARYHKSYRITKENPPIADRTIDKKHSCIIKSITAKLVPIGSVMFVYLTCSSGNLFFI